MLAKLSTELPTDSDLLYEPKWDGFRTIIFRTADDVYMQSRDLRPLDRYFPELHEALIAGLPTPCVLDGEIFVAHDGRLQFEVMTWLFFVHKIVKCIFYGNLVGKARFL